MTTIRINVRDQVLSLLTAPIVTTNGHNENKVVFKFSKEWEGLNKTAVFFHEPEHKYNVVLVNDEALIPNEVLTKSGLLSISVFGEGDNGELRKTTNNLKYKIIEGAPLDGIEIIDWESIAKKFQQSIISVLNEKFGVELSESATTEEIISKVITLEDGASVRTAIIAMLNSAADYINSQADTSQGEEIGYYAVPLELLSETMANETLSATINSNFQRMGNTTAYYLGVMEYLDEMKMELDNDSVIGGDTSRDVRSLAYSIFQKIITLKNNSGVLINNILGIFENDDEIHLDSDSSATEITEAISGVVSQRTEIINDLYSLYTGGN